MDFTYSSEQTMLQDSLGRLLTQVWPFEQRQKLLRAGTPRSAALWSGLAEMGLLALPLSEELGGLGGTASDLAAIGELFGRHLVSEPLLGSVLLGAAALGEARAGVVDGSEIVALAHQERHGIGPAECLATTLERADGGLVLSGEKLLVLDAAAAQVMVVSARLEGRLALVRLDPALPGVTLRRYVTIDGREAAHVHFAGVNLPGTALISADAAAALDPVIDRALLFLSAETVGAMTALLEQTSAYAATRKQFGVAIGSFQAIAHRLADMKIAWAKAQSLLLYTAALADAGQARPRDLALLKAQTGRLGRALGESAVQIHGGIGMTDELSVGHYLKRIVANETLFGSTDYHLRRIGAA